MVLYYIYIYYFNINNILNRKKILLILFPLYVGKTLKDKEMCSLLSKPFIPIEFLYNWIEYTPVRKIFRENYCTSGYSYDCGSQNSRHTRFVIAHSEVDMILKWFWDMFGCFEIVNVDKIILYEESGESIFNNGVLRSTVTGYFRDNQNKSYVMTARHVINNISAGNYVIQPTNSVILTQQNPIMEYFDIIIQQCMEIGNNILNLNPQNIVLTLSNNIQLNNSIIYKYGSATSRRVEMKMEYANFSGFIYLGGYEVRHYICSLHIAIGNENDSTSGDSGGPWFYQQENIGEIIGVHRAYIEYELNNERIQPPSNKRFFCATDTIPLLDQLNHLQWV